MSMFGDLLDNLPIGILPGSVPDDPSVPASRGDGQARAKAASPLTGKQLALQAAQDLCDVKEQLEQLVRLQSSPVENFLAAGSIAGGGTATAVPIPVMNGNPKRRGLSIQNIGAAGNLTLGLGMTDPQPNMGLVLLPGESWDGRVSGAVFRGAVSVVGVAAGVAYSWLEM
jgi:hypothetical protein